MTRLREPRHCNSENIVIKEQKKKRKYSQGWWCAPNPSTWKAEATGLSNPGQPELDSVSKIHR